MNDQRINDDNVLGFVERSHAGAEKTLRKIHVRYGLFDSVEEHELLRRRAWDEVVLIR